MGVKASKKSDKKKAEALAVKDIIENPRIERDGLTGITWSIVRAKAILLGLSGIPKQVVNPPTKNEYVAGVTPNVNISPTKKEEEVEKSTQTPLEKGWDYVMSLPIDHVMNFDSLDFKVVSESAYESICVGSEEIWFLDAKDGYGGGTSLRKSENGYLVCNVEYVRTIYIKNKRVRKFKYSIARIMTDISVAGMRAMLQIQPEARQYAKSLTPEYQKELAREKAHRHNQRVAKHRGLWDRNLFMRAYNKAQIAGVDAFAYVQIQDVSEGESTFEFSIHHDTVSAVKDRERKWEINQRDMEGVFGESRSEM